MAARTLLSPAPKPKSKILFQLLTTEDEIKYQAQTDILLGNRRDGKVKKRVSASVLMSALDELGPNAPAVWGVGGDAEAVSEPVLFVTSRRNSFGLNV